MTLGEEIESRRSKSGKKFTTDQRLYLDRWVVGRLRMDWGLAKIRLGLNRLIVEMKTDQFVSEGRAPAAARELAASFQVSYDMVTKIVRRLRGSEIKAITTSVVVVFERRLEELNDSIELTKQAARECLERYQAEVEEPERQLTERLEAQTVIGEDGTVQRNPDGSERITLRPREVVRSPKQRPTPGWLVAHDRHIQTLNELQRERAEVAARIAACRDNALPGIIHLPEARRASMERLLNPRPEKPAAGERRRRTIELVELAPGSNPPSFGGGQP